MGWTASYQVLRATPLTADEIGAIAALVRRQRKLPWDSERFSVRVAQHARADGVVADGRTKMAMGTESKDSERLTQAITELARLIPSGEVRVHDDFGGFDWDPEHGCVIDGGRHRSAEAIDVPYGELADPLELVPAPPVVLDPALDVAGVLAMFGELDDDAQKKVLAERLATCDAREVAGAIYARYDTLDREYYARSALRDALSRLDDPATLASAFLAVWRAPSGTYFYGDMPLPDRFRDAIARVPEAVDQFIADVAITDQAGTEDIPWRCAEVALDLLARGKTDRSLRTLLELVRAARGREAGWRMQSYVIDRAHEVLATHGDARVVPTLLQYLGTMTRMHRAHDRALRALVMLAPDRARPHVLTLAAAENYTDVIVELLAGLGGADTAEPLRRIAQHPSRSPRDEAAVALRVLGEEPPVYVERTIEDRATDRDWAVRKDAMRELANRKDKAIFVALVLCESLDRCLRARTDNSALPFSWWDWKDLLPDSVIKADADTKLAWANREGRDVIGPQRIWPSVATILELGPAAVAATYLSPLLAFEPATLAALEAEESQILAALG